MTDRSKRKRAASRPSQRRKHPLVTSLPRSPWLMIFYQPRQTIRYIVDTDPRRYVVLLAILSGIVTAPGITMQLGLSLPLTLLLSLWGGAFGLVGVYASGLLLRWTGRWLGGVGTSTEIRAAVAWSTVPCLPLSVLSLLITLVAVNLGFATASQLSGTGVALFFTLTTLLGLALFPYGIWCLIIICRCLGEVHRFSAWRGLGTYWLGMMMGTPLWLMMSLPYWLAIRGVI